MTEDMAVQIIMTKHMQQVSCPTYLAAVAC